MRGQKVEIDTDGGRQAVGSVGNPKELLAKVRNEDWNEYILTTLDGRTVLKINGVTMCEVVDRDPRRTPKGHLALQVHNGPPMKVQFRNIRIRQYDDRSTQCPQGCMLEEGLGSPNEPSTGACSKEASDLGHRDYVRLELRPKTTELAASLADLR